MWCNSVKDFIMFSDNNNVLSEKFIDICLNDSDSNIIICLKQVQSITMFMYVLNLACLYGRSELLEYCLSSKYVTNVNFGVIFRTVCMNGHLKDAKWLYKTFIHVRNIIKQDTTCVYRTRFLSNNILMSKWLLSIDVEKDIDVQYILNSCAFNSYNDLFFWLSDNCPNFQRVKYDEIAVHSCRGNNIELLKFLISTKGISIHVYNDVLMRTAIDNSYFAIIEFLLIESSNGVSYSSSIFREKGQDLFGTVCNTECLKDLAVLMSCLVPNFNVVQINGTIKSTIQCTAI